MYLPHIVRWIRIYVGNRASTAEREVALFDNTQGIRNKTARLQGTINKLYVGFLKAQGNRQFLIACFFNHLIRGHNHNFSKNPRPGCLACCVLRQGKVQLAFQWVSSLNG